ncbi:MAG: hypothetical protein RBS36_00470 [Thiomicrospira sp.]|jgi:hypothetical protein|nr:hypothetical protein [Thiomicrospira sp.]
MSKSKVLPEDWSQEVKKVERVVVASDLVKPKKGSPAWFWVGAIFAIGAGAGAGFAWTAFFGVYTWWTVLPVALAMYSLVPVVNGMPPLDTQSTDADNNDRRSYKYGGSKIIIDGFDPRDPYSNVWPD